MRVSKITFKRFNLTEEFFHPDNFRKSPFITSERALAVVKILDELNEDEISRATIWKEIRNLNAFSGKKLFLNPNQFAFVLSELERHGLINYDRKTIQINKNMKKLRLKINKKNKN